MRRFVLAPTLIALVAALALLGSAAAQEAPLIVFGDMVFGHVNPPEGRACTLNNRFTHEQMVVWRVKVIDPATGVEMDDAELDTVELRLADGQVFEMSFGEHPPGDPTDAYWTRFWTIPADYPTGVVEYTVVATAADGRTGELIPFPIETSTLTIVAAE